MLNKYLSLLVVFLSLSINDVRCEEYRRLGISNRPIAVIKFTGKLFKYNKSELNDLLQQVSDVDKELHFYMVLQTPFKYREQVDIYRGISEQLERDIKVIHASKHSFRYQLAENTVDPAVKIYVR